MDEKITFIPFSQLLIIFIPVGMVVFILRSWSLEWINSLYAIGRMLIQLIIIAYFLTFLFSTNNSLITALYFGFNGIHCKLDCIGNSFKR